MSYTQCCDRKIPNILSCHQSNRHRILTVYCVSYKKFTTFSAVTEPTQPRDDRTANHNKAHQVQCVTHTHPFNSPLSGTTRVSRYQKGKTNLDFIEARDSEWQWNQLDHMQVCTLLQTDNHASTHHSVFYRPHALPAAQPTESKH